MTDNSPPFLGTPVPDWTPRPSPNDTTISGDHCRLEKLSAARHAAQLHAANQIDADGVIWNYLPYGPFEKQDDYAAWIEAVSTNSDPHFYAIIDPATDSAIGVASYLRIKPAEGSIEVGHINYSPLLQNTVAATEAMFLMMKQAFEWGYRRYEWKCNALNARSCRAALRLGFTPEGIFRQATVIKDRNRDTAWFSIIDSEWPLLQGCFEQWLDPANFDQHGQQQSSLSALTAAAIPDRYK